MNKGYIIDIEKAARGNEAFRKVLYTATHSQLVLMSLKPGEEIGNEVHKVDQFFRFEEGEGEVVLNMIGGASGQSYPVKDGMALIVPAGTWHNIRNLSETKALKLYSIYSPPHHRDAVMHKTKEEGEADKADDFKGITTEHNG